MKRKEIESLTKKSLSQKDNIFHNKSQFLRFLMFSVIRLNTDNRDKPVFEKLCGSCIEMLMGNHKYHHLARFLHYTRMHYYVENGKESTEKRELFFEKALQQYFLAGIKEGITYLDYFTIKNFKYKNNSIYREFLTPEKELREGKI